MIDLNMLIKINKMFFNTSFFKTND